MHDRRERGQLTEEEAADLYSVIGLGAYITSDEGHDPRNPPLPPDAPVDRGFYPPPIG